MICPPVGGGHVPPCPPTSYGPDLCLQWMGIRCTSDSNFLFFEINIQSTSNNDDKGVSVYKPRVMYFCCGWWNLKKKNLFLFFQTSWIITTRVLQTETQFPFHSKQSADFFKGQLNSEWIYEVIISPKMPTKNYQDFCPSNKFPGQKSK